MIGDVSLQFGFCLEEGNKLLGQHDVPLNLKLSLHESCLGIELVERNVNEIVIADCQCGVDFASWSTLFNDSILQVQSCRKNRKIQLINCCDYWLRTNVCANNFNLVQFCNKQISATLKLRQLCTIRRLWLSCRLA